MFPLQVASGVFSIEPGREVAGVPAMTFSAKVAVPSGALLDAQVRRSIVRHVHKLTYEEADVLLAQPERADAVRDCSAYCRVDFARSRITLRVTTFPMFPLRLHSSRC